MARISIYDLKPGMILAEDLHGSEGRFLLGKGAVIAEKHLVILKTWGVTEAEIVCEECPEEPPPPTDEMIEKVSGLVAPAFALNDLSFSPVAEIHRLCVERLAGRMAAGRSLEFRHPPAVPDDWLVTPPDPAPSPEELAARCSELASLPDIYFRIVEVLEHHNVSVGAITEVVEKDTGLSAKLLRLVNSPFYGFPYNIDSVEYAVSLLGSNELSTLAMGISVLNSFEKVPVDLVDMRDFWRHSIACGVFARILARHEPLLSEARFFMAGILHDVGKLVIFSVIPEYGRAALALAVRENLPSHVAERRILGYDHALAGEALLKRWKIPLSLRCLVGGHHNLSGRESLIETSVVHVADVLSVCLEIGFGRMRVAPPLLVKGWKALGLSENVFAVALRQGERQYQDILTLFSANGVANV